MDELALFAGAGGGILGSILLGHRVVCAVEIESYCREVLLRRQEEKILPPFPVWDDIRTFDGRPWRGCVDIVSAGFPCQPFSVAGVGKAEDDDRNLWPDTIRVIREVQPEWCLLENVPGLLARPYVRTIFRELAESGYDAEWDCISAAALGAWHKRERLWIVAHTDKKGLERREYGIVQKCTGERITGQGDTPFAHTKCMRKSQQKRGKQKKRRRFGNSDKETDVAHTDKDRSGTGRKSRIQSQKQKPVVKNSINNGEEAWWKSEPGVGSLFPNGVAIRLGENINEKMLVMWKSFASEKIRETIRGQWIFQEAEILQPLMYGYWTNKRISNKKCCWEKDKTSAEAFMRDMRNVSETLYTSQGWKPLQQQIGELADSLLFVSYVIASQTGRFGKEEAKTSMRYLRQNIIQAWTLFNPSDTIQEAWQSIDSAWKACLVLGRWVLEPPVPRLVKNLPFRVDRIKALGNGQVPQVVAKAWEVLTERFCG